MTVLLRAITPKRFLVNAEKNTKRNLRSAMVFYTDTVAAIMRTEPAERPQPKNPKTRKYTRTHNLSASWTTNVNSDGTRGLVFVDPSSPAFDYAVHVQGPLLFGQRGIGRTGQTRRNRKAGWISITDAARSTRRAFRTVMNRAIVGGAEEIIVQLGK